MLEFQKPIPVIVEDTKDGYAIYVTNSGQFENDIWCVVLCDGGHVRHYRSDQIKIHSNATFNIKKTNIMNMTNEKIQPHEYLTIISELRELLKSESHPVNQTGYITKNKYGLDDDQIKVIKDKLMMAIDKLM